MNISQMGLILLSFKRQTLGSALDFLFGMILYTPASILYRILDWLQSIFRSLAGLEPITIDGTVVNSGANGEPQYDIVYYLTRTDLIQDIFFSLLIFSFILIIITTTIALVKNLYQDKQKTPASIIMSAFTSLFMFLFVPIAAVVGLMCTNFILQAVDVATSRGHSTGNNAMATTIFLASAYDANVLRSKSLDECRKNYAWLCDHTNFDTLVGVPKEMANSLTRDDFDELATEIDHYMGQGMLKDNNGDVTTIYDIHSDLPSFYYISQINWLIMIVGGCVMVYAMFKLCWGLVGRMFKLVIDFVLIPPVIAMIPLDDKKAYNAWKGDFIKNLTLGYGTVAGLNLYFSILPIIRQIKFNAVFGGGLFDIVFRLFVQIVGLMMVEKTASSIGGWFGSGDLIAEGKATWDAFKEGKGKVLKGEKKLIGAYGGFMSGIKTGTTGKKGFDKVWSGTKGGVQGLLAGTGLNKDLKDFSFNRNMNEARKAGKDYVLDNITNNHAPDLWVGDDRSAAAKGKADASKAWGEFLKANPVIADALKDEKSDEYKTALKLATKKFAATAEGQALINKGGFKIDDDETKGKVTSTEYQNRTEIIKANYEKQNENAQKIDSFRYAMSDVKRAKQNVMASIGENKTLASIWEQYEKGNTSYDSMLKKFNANKASKDVIKSLMDYAKSEEDKQKQYRETAIALAKEGFSYKDADGNLVTFDDADTVSTYSEKDIEDIMKKLNLKDVETGLSSLIKALNDTQNKIEKREKTINQKMFETVTNLAAGKLDNKSEQKAEIAISKK